MVLITRRSKHGEDDRLRPMSCHGQVHRTRHPHACRTDDGKHARHHRHDAPQRRRGNPEHPEDPAAERTLHDGDDDDTIHAGVGDVADPGQQRLAACPFEGKQIGNLATSRSPSRNSRKVAKRMKMNETTAPATFCATVSQYPPARRVSSLGILVGPRSRCGGIESQRVTEPLFGLSQRRAGRQASSSGEPCCRLAPNAGTARWRQP